MITTLGWPQIVWIHQSSPSHLSSFPQTTTTSSPERRSLAILRRDSISDKFLSSPAAMVAVFNKELLSWYLITLKLRETLDANLPKSQPPTPGATTKNPPPLLLTGAVEPTAPPPPPDSEWVISIREKLRSARQDESASPWSKLSIYRVPKYLHEGGSVGDKVYAPQTVSLGPYHHSKRRLRDMERHKFRALHRALSRSGHDIRLYLDAVSALEDRARDCYEGPISLSSNDFVEMMVLDGIFVLELFRGAASPDGFQQLGYSRHDPVFAMRGAMHSIQRDMIMLENQIPLFVLERLLSLQLNRSPEQSSGLLAQLALRFFDPLTPTDEPLRQSDRSKIESLGGAFDPLSDAGLHCLDVFRHSLLRTSTTGPQPAARRWMKRWSHNRRAVADKRRQQLIHCVTELREAGVKFRRRKTDRFWDVRFEGGVLEVPRILIHDGTKSLFLNLIAFEQCHMDCTSDITSYVIFMDNLINSGDDVAYLHYCGIVEHWLGDDGEVAELFNRLCQEVVFDVSDSYLSGLSERVNRYYDHRWNAWRATLKHRYFNNPWAIVSFVAAVVLLVMTLVQTFYGVYGYYWPRS